MDFVRVRLLGLDHAYQTNERWMDVVSHGLVILFFLFSPLASFVGMFVFRLGWFDGGDLIVHVR